VINFRTKTDALASSIAIFAILLLVATAAWLYMPLPSQVAVVESRARQLKSLDNKVSFARKDNAKIDAAIAPFVWVGKPDQVGPEALDTVTKLVKSAKVRLLAFRPQKPDEEPGVTLYSYGITIDGPYTNAMQLVKQLEDPKNKLAVSLVQINSADTASDRVTGTINVVAYVRPDEPLEAQGSKNVQKS
jgi:hypothetical protein